MGHVLSSLNSSPYLISDGAGTITPGGPASSAAPATGSWSSGESELLEALKTYPKVYTELTPQPESGEESFQPDEVAKLKAIAPVAAFADLRPAVQSMRAVKSPVELALIRKAVENSVGAHLAAMKSVRPGAFEYEIYEIVRGAQLAAIMAGK